MSYKEALINYCNYQERCQQDVRTKLLSLGCRGEELEEVIAYLIQVNLLNEERFAKALARGKFKMNEWGKVKILQLLKQKNISSYCINKALKEISDVDYENLLQKLHEKKWKALKSEKNIFIKKRKALNYLLQKGFESERIYRLLMEY